MHICQNKIKYFYEIIIPSKYLLKLLGGARGVMEMDTATQIQILDETNCISHSTNTLGKGMNPIILPPAMGK